MYDWKRKLVSVSDLFADWSSRGLFSHEVRFNSRKGSNTLKTEPIQKIFLACRSRSSKTYDVSPSQYSNSWSFPYKFRYPLTPVLLINNKIIQPCSARITDEWIQVIFLPWYQVTYKICISIFILLTNLSKQWTNRDKKTWKDLQSDANSLIAAMFALNEGKIWTRHRFLDRRIDRSEVVNRERSATSLFSRPAFSLDLCIRIIGQMASSFISVTLKYYGIRFPVSFHVYFWPAEASRGVRLFLRFYPPWTFFFPWLIYDLCSIFAKDGTILLNGIPNCDKIKHNNR